MSGGTKATARTAISGGGHYQSPFWQWPLPLITVPVVALNSSSGGELKLYLGWKRNTYTPVYPKKMLFGTGIFKNYLSTVNVVEINL